MSNEKDTQKSKQIDPVDCYIDISGPDQYGHGKAHIALVYSTRYDDEKGTTVVHRELTIPPKAIVMISQHAGYANVLMDFLSNDDEDLRQAWDLLQEYSRPENSVAWSDEEYKNHVYVDEDGNEQPIYFPCIDLILSPVGRETEYQICGYNPAFYTLQPGSPQGIPSVLQLTFPEEWFVVADDIEPVDIGNIEREIQEEEEAELMRGGVDRETTE